MIVKFVPAFSCLFPLKSSAQTTITVAAASDLPSSPDSAPDLLPKSSRWEYHVAMADFEPAVEITLQNEGGFFHNTVTGEVVNFGVTLTFASGCGLCGASDQDFIRNLTQEQATDIYKAHFWSPHNFGSINDQSVANKAFDLTVNMGPGNQTHPGALTLLQNAVCDCGGNCSVDGVLGPQSLGAINALNSSELLPAYRVRAKARYEEIGTDPKLAPDLPAWLARLEK